MLKATTTQDLLDQVSAALVGSEFARADVRAVDHWDGVCAVLVEWSWSDEAREALIEHLRGAGLNVEDRLSRPPFVLVTR